MEPMMRKRASTSTKRQSASAVDPLFAPVVAAFSHDPQVSMKRMFSSENVLTVKGKIFAMLVKGRFVAKLPKARVDALVGARLGEHFDPGHGRLMKEWVSIPHGKADWLELATEAHRFVKQAK
jgi:hypothetical protein